MGGMPSTMYEYVWAELLCVCVAQVGEEANWLRSMYTAHARSTKWSSVRAPAVSSGSGSDTVQVICFNAWQRCGPSGLGYMHCSSSWAA